MTRVELLSESQIEDLHRLYQNEWWSKDRTIEETRRMVAATRIFVAFADEAGRLSAFARVLTDFVFKAFVFDVIVDPSYRVTGLGKALIDAVVGHPELSGVRHFELYCRPELIPFYERWGFSEVGDVRLLRRAL